MDFPIGFPWTFGGPALVAPDDVETPDVALAMELRRDVAGDGESLLLDDFRGLPRVGAVLRGLLAGVQDAEGALWQLFTERALATAVGRQLDQAGTVLDLPRAGRLDGTYRAFLLAQVRALRSDGTWTALVGVLEALKLELPTVRYVEAGDAASLVVLLTDGLVEHVGGRAIFRLLDRARLGGVRLVFEYPSEGHDDSDSFAYARTGDAELDTARGYGSATDPDIGGFYGGAAASSEMR